MKKKQHICRKATCLWLHHLKCQSDNAKSGHFWLVVKSLFFLPAFCEGNSEQAHRKSRKMGTLGKWNDLAENIVPDCCAGKCETRSGEEPCGVYWLKLPWSLTEAGKECGKVGSSPCSPQSVCMALGKSFLCSVLWWFICEWNQKCIYNLTAQVGIATLNSEVLR